MSATEKPADAFENRKVLVALRKLADDRSCIVEGCGAMTSGPAGDCMRCGAATCAHHGEAPRVPLGISWMCPLCIDEISPEVFEMWRMQPHTKPWISKRDE